MIVPVIGMHRSGTSAISGLLHRNGILMGEDQHFIPRPSPENPKGFYENFRFRKLNDDVLRNSGYRVKSWSTSVPDIRSSFLHRLRMRYLLSLYNKRHNCWGWKDPRICLTLHEWCRAFSAANMTDQVHALFVVRNPNSVSASLKKRNSLSLDDALRLWTVYNNRALSAIASFHIRTFYLSYEEVLSSPMSTINRAMTFLHQKDCNESEVTNFIDPRLNRSRNTFVPSQTSTHSQRAETTYTDLLQRIEQCNA